MMETQVHFSHLFTSSDLLLTVYRISFQVADDVGLMDPRTRESLGMILNDEMRFRYTTVLFLSQHRDKHFHTDDLIPPDNPVTAFGSFPPFVPSKFTCESTICGLQIVSFATPR